MVLLLELEPDKCIVRLTERTINVTTATGAPCIVQVGRPGSDDTCCIASVSTAFKRPCLSLHLHKLHEEHLVRLVHRVEQSIQEKISSATAGRHSAYAASGIVDISGQSGPAWRAFSADPLWLEYRGRSVFCNVQQAHVPFESLAAGERVCVKVGFNSVLTLSTRGLQCKLVAVELIRTAMADSGPQRWVDAAGVVFHVPPSHPALPEPPHGPPVVPPSHPALPEPPHGPPVVPPDTVEPTTADRQRRRRERRERRERKKHLKRDAAVATDAYDSGRKKRARRSAGDADAALEERDGNV
jgi:hypothetical protein